jgi:hypothetical protein
MHDVLERIRHFRNERAPLVRKPISPQMPQYFNFKFSSCSGASRRPGTDLLKG